MFFEYFSTLKLCLCGFYFDFLCLALLCSASTFDSGTHSYFVCKFFIAFAYLIALSSLNSSSRNHKKTHTHEWQCFLVKWVLEPNTCIENCSIYSHLRPNILNEFRKLSTPVLAFIGLSRWTYINTWKFQNKSQLSSSSMIWDRRSKTICILSAYIFYRNTTNRRQHRTYSDNER